MRILIIDDGSYVNAAAALELQGHDVTHTNYRDAEELMLSKQFDAVLVDALLPVDVRRVRGEGVECMPLGQMLIFHAAAAKAKYAVLGWNSQDDFDGHPAAKLLSSVDGWSGRRFRLNETTVRIAGYNNSREKDWGEMLRLTMQG